MPAQQGHFDTLKNVASKVFTYLSTITLTGTDGKTITVTQDTSLDEAGAMSSKAPKADPVFTGHVTGTTAAKKFAAVNPTNMDVMYVGGAAGNVVMANNTFIDITIGTISELLSIGNELGAGNGALFFACYSSATIVKLADPAGIFVVVSGYDAGKIAVWKSAGSAHIYVYNYTGANIALSINILGQVNAATAPV